MPMLVGEMIKLDRLFAAAIRLVDADVAATGLVGETSCEDQGRRKGERGVLDARPRTLLKGEVRSDVLERGDEGAFGEEVAD